VKTEQACPARVAAGNTMDMILGQHDGHNTRATRWTLYSGNTMDMILVFFLEVPSSRRASSR
jgi:hypothetical protein